jgi:hypothetical protein
MSDTPQIVIRVEQPYVAITGRVSMAELGAFATRAGEVFAWVGARGLSPAGLIGATKALLDWAAGQGLTWDMSPGETGDRRASRLEIYLTDPNEEPDMSKWVTQLAFRLAD